MLKVCLKNFSNLKKVVLFPGHGVGPEITEGVTDIFRSLKVPIEWEEHKVHSQAMTRDGDLISEDSLKKIKEYGLALKGPLTTPIGKGYRSINVTLRKKLKTYANVRPCKTIEGVLGLMHNNINLVTIRENTEGEYAGIEHEVIPGVCENYKIITEEACENICRYAFEFARRYKRKKVTCAHKFSVMPLGDGCFIRTARRISSEYPEITYNEEQIDILALKITKNPELIDVMVMPNLYGDIVSDLCAGLIGGLGLTPSGNIGKDCAVFEAVHGSAPDIAGKGLANPTALLFSSTMMLKYMDLHDFSNKIDNSIFKVIKENKWTTPDLGGKATTKEYVKEIIENLD